MIFYNQACLTFPKQKCQQNLGIKKKKNHVFITLVNYTLSLCNSKLVAINQLTPDNSESFITCYTHSSLPYVSVCVIKIATQKKPDKPWMECIKYRCSVNEKYFKFYIHDHIGYITDLSFWGLVVNNGFIYSAVCKLGF